jgi:IclR family KDG regulon transcriptional repressor
MEIEKSKVPALTRAAKLLDILAQFGPMTRSELVTKSNIPHSSGYNIVDELVKLGFLRQDSNGKICLWMKTIYLGEAASRSLDLKDVVLPPLLSLLNSYDCIHVQFGMIYGDKAFYVLKRANQKSAFQAMAREGMEMSMVQAGLGKLLLAYQDEAFRERLLPQLDYSPVTPTSITSPDALRKELAKIRLQGWSLGNEEGESGFRSISAPVFDRNHNLKGGISIVGTAFKFTDEILPQIANSTMQCANSISQSLL